VETFDLIVIGSGSAGVSAALRASDKGARVCIIEADRIGGSCLLKGLYPLKLGLNLLNRNKQNFFSNGVVDSEKLFNSIREPMRLLSHSWEQKLINSGVTIKMGEGLPISSSLVQVKLNGDTYDIGTKKIVIATGSRPISLSTIPFERNGIISSDDIFESH